MKLYEMNTREKLKKLITDSLESIVGDVAINQITIEIPKSAEHGDYSSNIALQLAKKLRKNPRQIAEAIRGSMPHDTILEKVDIAGAGFLNFYLRSQVKQRIVVDILTKSDQFGAFDHGVGKKVLLEFVSANPTGPLHVGHGRGAAFGASLSNILKKCGFLVSREYYVNDAGRQTDILTVSVWCRYLELSGLEQEFPSKGYKGKYIKDLANLIKAKYGDRWLKQFQITNLPHTTQDDEMLIDLIIKEAKRLLGKDYYLLKKLSLESQLMTCKEDLSLFRVDFDGWFSEESVFSNGMVREICDRLNQGGYTDVREEAIWFKATEFNDDKDRVLKRANGDYTYFASDIAYHHDKYSREFDKLVNVWGADHHGYIARVKAALQGLGHNTDILEIILIQFAVLFRGQQKVPMSTRSGEFVSLRELIDEVGVDAARYFYALRKSDQHLDFDLDLAKAKNNENPVFYVQYAHARCSSLISKWNGKIEELTRFAQQTNLDQPDELLIMQKLAEYPDVLKKCCQDLVIHNVPTYLRELSHLLHRYYTATPVLSADEPERSARVSLVAAVKQVLHNGLSLLGVSAPDKM